MQYKLARAVASYGKTTVPLDGFPETFDRDTVTCLLRQYYPGASDIRERVVAECPGFHKEMVIFEAYGNAVSVVYKAEG